MSNIYSSNWNWYINLLFNILICFHADKLIKRHPYQETKKRYLSTAFTLMYKKNYYVINHDNHNIYIEDNLMDIVRISQETLEHLSLLFLMVFLFRLLPWFQLLAHVLRKTSSKIQWFHSRIFDQLSRCRLIYCYPVDDQLTLLRHMEIINRRKSGLELQLDVSHR